MSIRPDESVTEYLERSQREREERMATSRRSPQEAAAIGIGYNGPLLPDKGQKDGSCNRTACQMPLAAEPAHQFMDGNFTGRGRLYYCAKCAADFDDWDYRSGDRVRIAREPKQSDASAPVVASEVVPFPNTATRQQRRSFARRMQKLSRRARG